ncbi:MAG: DUF2232 domain-containing protein [Gemmatimonadaceae bacterium]|nr:DUF2232 domain-containing protein [Gemmatimonadaceae bacterium]
MTVPTTPSTASPIPVTSPAPRGWFRLLVAMVLALSIPVIAQLRLVVPVEQTILFLGPAMAACGLVAWWLGGRLLMFVAWGGLAVWMLSMSPPSAPSFDPLSRGWVLLVGAAFGVVSWMDPRRTFFPRALAATAIAYAVSLGILAVGSAEVQDVGRSVSDEFARRLAQVSDQYETRARTPEWRSFVERFPGAADVVEQGEAQLPTIARTSIGIFPALLGLQSLAMLALAYAVFHRSSRTRIGPLLRPLAEFRFSDQLIWGVVLGVTLLVLPRLGEAKGIGLNLVVFFGALYALRGLGVLSWFLAPGRPTPVLLVVAACLAGPVVGIFSLGLGLADTWIDWRGRLRPAG